jgi:tetratricopeptide (TPR) repeat protein
VELSFWIWLLALLLIAGGGLGAMLFAYWGKGSVAVVFPEPIAANPPAPTLNSEAAALFEKGCESYRAGRYRQAVTRFTEALQLDAKCAEAYHNRGRATANLRRVTDAVADLVKASELYLQQSKVTELAQLKQDLATLK